MEIFIQRQNVPKTLEEVAREEYLKNSNEIFSIIYNDEKYWVKKARPTRSTNWHRLFYALCSFDVLIPSENKSGEETILHETSKLNLFREKGIHTPHVMYQCEDFFILEDCGETLNTLTRNKSITKEQMYYYLDKLLFELAKIHNQNLFHGGAQTRNFTYKDSNIYAIDLEESFDSTIDVSVLQFRDFLLLLLSFIKIKASFDLDYNYIVQKYVSLTNNSSIIVKLKKLANKISFLIHLSDKPWIQKLLRSDAKGFFKLFKILKAL